MPEDRKGKTYSFDVCSQCKLICCQDANPPLTPNRAKTLTKYVTEQKIPLTNLFSGDEYLHPATDSDGFCIFYNKKTGKCWVHSVKPETCCAGPITFDINFETRKVEFFLKKAEICAFADALYEDQARLNVHLEVAKEEIFRLIFELDADALRGILKIPEAETFKICECNLPQNVILKLGIA